MKPATLIALAGLLLTLQSATLAYVMSMERRMTRVETIIEYRVPARVTEAERRT